MEIRKELIDELLRGYKKPEDALGEKGLLKQFKKAQCWNGLTHHLGYKKHDPAGYGSGNSRNGTSEKTLQGEDGGMPIEVWSGVANGLRAFSSTETVITTGSGPPASFCSATSW